MLNRMRYQCAVTGQQFLTPRLSVWLDLVRGIAAVAVLLGHAVQVGLYTGPWPFTIALQKNAVTVFFVLSGLVIASSVARGGMRLRDYALARAARIVPVALLGIAVALLVAAVDAASGAPIFPEDAGWRNPGEILRAVFFLSESWNTGFAPNPLMWSLAYEVWFYALFGAAMFLRGWTRVGWLVVLAVAAGPNIALLMPAWLVGALLCHWPRARDLPSTFARPLVVLACAMLVIAPVLAPDLFALLTALLPGWDLGFSLYALSDNLLALAIGGGFIGLRRLAQDGLEVPRRLVAPVRGLADISFTLYLLHWPVLKALRMADIGAGDSALRFALLIALVVGVCAMLAMAVERRTPALRRWLVDRAEPRKRGQPLRAAP